MHETKDYLKYFRDSLHNELYDILINKKIMSKDSAEATAYALHDIAESIEEIYRNIIPKIIENKDNSKEILGDLILDLKSEFSHILYHIEDAKLFGLKYWDEEENK